MEKNDVFTFTASNGVEVTAVVLMANRNYNWNDEYIGTHYLCYAQNRLFSFRETADGSTEYGSIIVDYAILPDYDTLLERYNEIEIAQAETQLGM